MYLCGIIVEAWSFVADGLREVGAATERRAERCYHRVQSTLSQEGHER